MRRTMFSCLAFCLAAVSAACSGPVSTYRFRLHVEVETPEGTKAGSSVIEVAWWTEIIVGHGELGKDSVTGDAVFVDLGDAKNVMALLGMGRTGSNRSISEMPMKAFGYRGGDAAERAMETQVGSADLTLDNMPTLVTFRDLKDPGSVEVVNPRDLAEAFGPGYSLGRVWIETTTDPVVQTIEQKLPWLPALIEKQKTSPVDIRVNGHYLELFRRSST